MHTCECVGVCTHGMCVPATSRHFSTAVDAPPLSQHLDGLTPCALCCTATADTFYAGETGCFDSSPRQSCCVGPQVSTLRGSWLPSPSQWLTLHTCLEVLSGWGEYKMDEGKLNLGGTMGSVLGFKHSWRGQKPWPAQDPRIEDGMSIS